MMPPPQSLDDVQRLVTNQVPESIYLDYKASAALAVKKREELAKDVSAFANSDGGILVYGVTEDPTTHLPLALDSGVDPQWNRERLEQILCDNISPHIEGIAIKEFRLSNGNLVICIVVPYSFQGPHQASNHKYYKRFNFSSFAMEHYEVEDCRARRGLAPLVSIELVHDDLFKFIIRNYGQAPAYDLKFTFPSEMKWHLKQPPRQFTHGIKILPPGHSITVPFSGYPQFCIGRPGCSEPAFPLTVTYQDGISGNSITEHFSFGLNDFQAAQTATPTLKAEMKDIAASLRKLVQSVGRIVDRQK